MYLLYSLVLTAGALLSLPYFLYRGLVSGKYWPSLNQRLGLLPASIDSRGQSSIWVHAVSVGEVIATRALLPLLRESFPGKPVFVSVTTLTGKQVADRQLREADGIFYCPFDWRFAVQRVISRIRPQALLVMETEIWPHMLRACHQAGAATMLVNGRISDRSYRRYRLIRPFLKRFLLPVDCFCMQNSRYAERIVDLGADPRKVRVTGSLKFDAVVPTQGSPSQAARLIPADRIVLVGGSTLAPEEEILLEVFQSLREVEPGLFLVIAPRHPERFDEVMKLAESRQLRVVRRSTLQQPAAEADVMILDTLGELASIYSAADLVFMGGSLATWGGHNLIEPAAEGKPVVFGPHMSNFQEIASSFLEAAAAIQVSGREELHEVLLRLLKEEGLRQDLGERARKLVEANRGAGKKTMESARQAVGTTAA
ncbi:MAG TPA: 3-deoxy-D-manno-octulosonic acid transferase [Vicinamibacteria bacterium]|nr:3-deoxy-D-manno-octulosonic acid transferase [Vicinamibacteria bacterium]